MSRKKKRLERRRERIGSLYQSWIREKFGENEELCLKRHGEELTALLHENCEVGEFIKEKLERALKEIDSVSWRPISEAPKDERVLIA